MQVDLKRDTNIYIKPKVKQISRLDDGGFIHEEKSNNNNFRERLLKQNPQDLSFKSLPFICNPKELETSFEKIMGKSCADDLRAKISVIAQNKNPWGTVENDKIEFKEASFPTEIKDDFIKPVLLIPVDLMNATIDYARKIKFLKKSKFIDGIADIGFLKNRRNYKEAHSEAMSVKNLVGIYAKYDEAIEKANEATNSDEKEKLIQAAKENLESRILSAGHKRFDTKIGNYNNTEERALTRVVTGAVPAFFLANDAYNLSMYVNKDNKEVSKKEKKRRFNQEAARIGITALSTYGVLSLFNKKGSSASTTACIVATTVGAEILGRMLSGAPFYPITKKGAKKIAQERKQKGIEPKTKTQHAADSSKNNTSQVPKKKNNFILELLGGLVLYGIAVEKAPKFSPYIKNIIEKNSLKYKALLNKDYTITKKEFADIIAQLKANGSDTLAEKYQAKVDKILAEGNFNAKDQARIEQKKLDIIQEELAKSFNKYFCDTTSEKYTTALDTVKKALNKNGSLNTLTIAKDLKIEQNIGDTIYLSSFQDSVKYIGINEVLAFPVKLIHSVLNMPYSNVVKPAYELVKNSIVNVVKRIRKIQPEPKVEKVDSLTDKDIMNSIEFIKHFNKKEGITDISKESQEFKDAFSSKVMDSLDNVTKSTISNAKLSGPLKQAVSTATSAFLIVDNYNLVMIDSEGKDQDLAAQKAKERTLQRIVRIAYGATIINFFNDVFSKTFNGSLLGAQVVNVLNTIVVEMMERKSVGLPIGESNKEDIIRLDNENLNATGIKGAYFRMMSKLTGKKAISVKASATKTN